MYFPIGRASLRRAARMRRRPFNNASPVRYSGETRVIPQPYAGYLDRPPSSSPVWLGMTFWSQVRAGEIEREREREGGGERVACVCDVCMFVYVYIAVI